MIDAAFCLGSVADNLDFHVLQAEAIIARLIDGGVYLSDGQLAATVLLTDHRRALLVDIYLKACIGAYILELIDLYDLTETEPLGIDMARDVFRELIDHEVEAQVADIRRDEALEDLFLPEHGHIACEMDRSQGIELVEHQLLAGELVDDIDGHALLGFHILHMEADIEQLFLLEMEDAAFGSDEQPLVGGEDMDILKVEGGVVAAEEHVELEGHGEVTQHGGEGA